MIMVYCFGVCMNHKIKLSITRNTIEVLLGAQNNYLRPACHYDRQMTDPGLALPATFNRGQNKN